MNEYERFERWAKERETKKKNWVAELDGQEFMRQFRNRYSVGKHFPRTHCPICTQRQLYLKDDTQDTYLCKMCKAEIRLTIIWRPEKTEVQELLQKKKDELEADDYFPSESTDEELDN